MAVTRRLRVDPVACDAFGHCAELAPELIWLDEWGYPVLDDRAVADHEVEVAELAVRTCPRRALFLEEIRPTVPPRPPRVPTAVGPTRRVSGRR